MEFTRRIIILLWCLASPIHAVEIAAHRGVYQTFQNDDPNACTARLIAPPTHNFIEHTVNSVREAFEVGATMVQIAVQKTSEQDGSSHIVVFHDAGLECRTDATCSNGCVCENGSCKTELQSLSYLKTLDVGYGYTADGGVTFPFRGHFIGAMPRLEEILDLLNAYPDKKIWINQKDNSEKTLRIIVQILRSYPVEVVKRVYIPRDISTLNAELDQLGIQVAPSYKTEAQTCMEQYILKGWLGIFPAECKNISLLVPTHVKRAGIPVTGLIWGWPTSFVQKMHANNSQVYAFDINTTEEWDSVKDANLDGIVSARIEIVAPYIGL